MYDLLIRGGWVVDPATGIDGEADVGIDGDRVSHMEPRGLSGRAREVIDARGLVVMPGIIDGHVHLADRRRGGIGHRRLALAGVTTAVEFADFGTVVEDLGTDGAGLNIAGLQAIGPYLQSPVDEGEIRRDTRLAMGSGALGIKIFGGHHPSTPEATEAMIRIANDEGCYVAYHVGTTASSSNLLGMRELPQLVGNRRLHLAHVNAYLRGMVEDLHSELREGFDILRRLPQVVSESHLAPYNGTSGALVGDELADEVTKNCLKMEGYSADRDGLEAALLDGYAGVNSLRGDRMVRLSGQSAHAEWLGAGGNCGLSFPVNRRMTAMACAVERSSGGEGAIGEFLVDALASDGGAWRNELLLRGLPLVQFGALSMLDLVRKISLAPAMMFGFRSKGTLAEGADADVTIVDPRAGRAVCTVVAGRIVATNGEIIGRGGRLYTTPWGRDALSERDHAVFDLDLADSLFVRKGSAGTGR